MVEGVAVETFKADHQRAFDPAVSQHPYRVHQRLRRGSAGRGKSVNLAVAGGSAQQLGHAGKRVVGIGECAVLGDFGFAVGQGVAGGAEHQRRVGQSSLIPAGRGGGVGQ